MTVANINIRQILLKRGNTQAASQYVGPIGEIVLDTDLETIRVQDGVTPGGNVMLVNSNNIASINEAIVLTNANIISNIANVNTAWQANTALLYNDIQTLNQNELTLSNAIANTNANVTTLQSQVYSNSNVASYLTITTIQTSGNITSNVISGNLLSISFGSNIAQTGNTTDPIITSTSTGNIWLLSDTVGAGNVKTVDLINPYISSDNMVLVNMYNNPGEFAVGSYPSSANTATIWMRNLTSAPITSNVQIKFLVINTPTV